jgi:hypothetical protein
MLAKHVTDRDLGLKAFKRQLEIARVVEVTVGIHQGQNNKEGDSIAYYAAANEFGASIEVAARSQQQYRSVRKNGVFNKQGRFVSKDKANFASWATIGAHSIRIPERSFMRTSFDDNIAKIQRDIEIQHGLVVQGKKDIRAALGEVGLRHQRRIKAKILSNIAPENTPSTKRKKKSSRTLIDTGAMLNSVHYVVSGKK